MLQPSTPETQLLKQVTQSLDEQDQWPIFSLRDVEIYRTDDRNYPSEVELWRAEPTAPVIVEGILARLPRALQKHYCNANSAPTEAQRVKIADCTNWSYGQYEDGQIALWAGGQAGWYELRPGKEYSTMHRRVKQAIKLLYFSADFYRDRLKTSGRSASRRKGGIQQIAVETLFAEYVKEPKHRCMAHPSNVRARFREHAEVLTMLMRRGKEAVGWKWEDTTLFEWLSSYLASKPSALPPREDLLPSPVMSPRRADSSEDEAMSASIESTSRARVAGKGISGLRPKGTSDNGSPQARTRSPTVTSDADIVTSDADIEMPDADPASRSGKRKQEQLDSPIRLSGRVSKRLAATAGESGQSLPSPSPISSSREEESSGVVLPIRSDYRAADMQSDSVSSPNLISTTLPNFDPLPGIDTWHCPFDGCMTKYYGVNTQQGVPEMIRKHYAVHAIESQRQMDLIMREERPYLPVGNLVRHVRGMVAAESKRGNVSTDAADGPGLILRRY